MRARLAALALLLCGACTTARGEAAEDPEPASPATPRLVELESRPRDGGGPAAFGLSGANKPNGIEQRLRRSVPAETPRFIPRVLDGRAERLELWIADPVPEGWLAFYRGPMELREGSANAEYRALLFGPAGEPVWDLPLNALLSRPDHLEIQDIRLRDGRLYLNEACQSYSREAGGDCSALVRIDPRRAAVDWRTRPRVSNNVFIFHGDHVVAGYGFTAEPDSLFLVARESGRIVGRAGLDSAHSYLEIVDGQLVVLTYYRMYRFNL